MHTDTTRENPQASAPQAADSSQDLAATAPGQLRVIKRNGTVVPYTDDKITVAITKAFLAVEGGTAAASSRIHDTVRRLTEQVTATFKRRMPSGGTIHIEEIQDQVELALMRAGEQKVARDYVIYREARAAERKNAGAASDVAQPHPSIRITRADGSLSPLDMGRLNTIISEACEGLAEVDGALIERETLKNLYDGVAEKDVNTALVMTARTLVEREPNYSYVTARLLMDTLRAEALGFLGVAESATHHEMAELYAKALPAYIEKGAEFELVDAKLKEFDLEKLGKAIDHERDQQFTYLGLQTLYDRYFIHKDGIRFELPQIFFMRVAMGLAIEEKDREARAIEFYNLLSSFDYMSSTPTLFNAGTLRPQLSSCYLTTVPDDLSGIYGAIHDNAMLSKFAGGLGNDWTPVRALGSYIKGTNGKSQGVVPFLKVVNDTAVAVNQGGKRKGAVCAYLETWHLDIEEFLELRKNTGDDRRRTHDMNTANWIPDLFMKRVFDDGSWTLFSPSDVPDLHDLYGKAFEERYEYYEALASYGKLKLHKVVQAKDLWRKMLSMLFETGHPWLTFKDPCNLRSPQQHVGVVHSSNLCTEITLNTNKDEIAVCNLGSINLVNHIVDGKLDTAKLEKTVKTAVRMLDNVIDINYYSVPQAQNSNFKHRPVGLGIMGFQDALYLQHIPYGSDAAIAFADQSMEAISYYAIQASCDLADERGAYQTFQGSLWSQGILPIDSEKKLIEERGAKYIEVDLSETLDWAPLRERTERHPQLEHHGHRADRDHRQHHRRLAVDRADLPEPVREVEPLRRVHRDQPLPGARPQGPRPVGPGHGQRPEVLRRFRAADRAHPAGPQGPLRHRVRSRDPLDRRSRQPSPEVDRPGPVAEPVHRRRLGQEARRDLPHGLVPRPEDHLLPPRPGRHQHREVHHQHRQAQRRVGRWQRRPASRPGRRAEAGAGAAGMQHRQPRLRSLPVIARR